MRQRSDNSAPTGAAAGCSLTELAMFIDEHLNRTTGLEAAVRAYRTNTDTAAACAADQEMRRAIDAKLNKYIEIRHNRLVTGGVFVLKVSGGGQRVAVRASIVQRKYPDLWEASRINQRQMAVKFAYAEKPRIVIPAMNTAADAWRAYETVKDREKAAKALAERARLRIIEVIDDMIERHLWDGAPKVTTDGWSVGQRYLLRFNSDKCRKLAAERGIGLTEIETVEDIPERRTYRLIESAFESGEYDGD